MTKLTAPNSAKGAIRAIVAGMSLAPAELKAPSQDEITALQEQLRGHVLQTPMWAWREPGLPRLFGERAELQFKFELLQNTGSFKIRGAFANLFAHLDQARSSGVIAVSAGNHAIAVASASRSLGVNAKVVMLKHANPRRIRACEDYGAEVELSEDVHAAFDRARALEQTEGRLFIHPFDSPHTVMGTATLGREIIEALPELDLMVVPIGGGGLAAGVSLAIKQLRPQCRVIGVEPTGADSMSRSFKAGAPVQLGRVDTIADSLAAPHAEQFSYQICRDNIDDIVLLDDKALRAAMSWLVQHAKVAVEPAGAASTAALLGPLREQAQNLRSCALLCGSNIDAASFSRLLKN